MINIQKTLDSLQPYVIGIRYVEGTPVVDTVFKDGWTLIEDINVKMVKGDETMNYYMLFSESPKIGLDDLLAYVEKVIKLNLEREKKHELLRLKVNELKEVFKKNTLTKLNRLRFSFIDEELVGDLNEFDVISYDESLPESSFNEEILQEETHQANNEIIRPTQYLDENGKPIELSEEELEIIEEEARAERNLKAIRNKQKPISQNKIQNKIELPPKTKQEIVSNKTYENNSYCECGPEQACDKCIDLK